MAKKLMYGGVSVPRVMFRLQVLCCLARIEEGRFDRWIDKIKIWGLIAVCEDEVLEPNAIPNIGVLSLVSKAHAVPRVTVRLVD